MQNFIQKTNAKDAFGNIVFGDFGVHIQQEVGGCILTNFMWSSSLHDSWDKLSGLINNELTKSLIFNIIDMCCMDKNGLHFGVLVVICQSYKYDIF